MYIIATKRVEIMCQNIQWIVSKFGEGIRIIMIRILVMLNAKRAIVAVRIDFILLDVDFTGVDKRRAKRR